MEHGPGHHDDEEGEEARERGTEEHVDARVRRRLAIDALVHHRGLHVEEEVRSDRGADEREREDEGRRTGRDRGDEPRHHDGPVGPQDEDGDRVGEEREHQHEEDALDEAVAEEHHQRPYRECGKRHRDDAGHTEELDARRDACVFGDHVAAVRDDEDDHREDRPAHAESLPDEVGQPLTGHQSHARAHLLDDPEPDARHEEEPQQREPEVGADRRVRGDAAGLVAREAGDDTRTDDREECGKGDPPSPHLAIDLSDLFLQPRGSMMSTTSSMVTVPRSFRRASTTGSASRLYFAMSAATSSLGEVASTLRTLRSMTSLIGVVGFATTRSRSEMTPSSRPWLSTTYR